MTGELRCRSLPDTLALAVRAAASAGVTRVSEVTAFAVPGVPVFQATRPAARSLSVSQGKGLTPTAAIVSALLEAVELGSAERLERPETSRPLAALAAGDVALWSGPSDKLAIDLNRELARHWLEGTDLFSGRPCAMPWDLLSLDFTRETLEYPATSNGLACGNSRTEALVSGLAELLEHHCSALFDRLTPRQRLAGQIALATIDDPAIRRVLHRVEAAGFRVRAWSMANEAGLAAIQCMLFQSERSFDDMLPVRGSGCHPSARTAFLRALLEAVQTRAGLVAGARDDLTGEQYEGGRKSEVAVFFGALAFGDGPLDWRKVPTASYASSGHCLDFLLAKAEQLGGRPVVAYDHAPPCPGLYLVHVLGPGLMHSVRRTRRPGSGLAAQPVGRALLRKASRAGTRKILFAGPSVAALPIPDGVEVLPPATCGDLAALLDDPPAAVALVDGYFRIAPTVWHKEIMHLLARGTRVIGGASLGALRAVELERFGMEGIGGIFHAYRSGAMVRDDAVMLVHAPAELGYAPLSVPLVDAEYALSLAALPPRVLRTMQRIVRTTPFETRTWRQCLGDYRARTGEDFPLSAAVLEAMPSLKRLDAELVIEELAGETLGEPGTGRAMPPLTSHYRRLLASRAPAFAAGPA